MVDYAVPAPRNAALPAIFTKAPNLVLPSGAHVPYPLATQRLEPEAK